METLLINPLGFNDINNNRHQNTSGQEEINEERSQLQSDDPFIKCNHYKNSQNSDYDNIVWNCIEDDNSILIDINEKTKRKPKTDPSKRTKETEKYKKRRRNNTVSARKSRLKTKMMELLRKAADAVPQ